MHTGGILPKQYFNIDTVFLRWIYLPACVWCVVIIVLLGRKWGGGWKNREAEQFVFAREEKLWCPRKLPFVANASWKTISIFRKTIACEKLIIGLYYRVSYLFFVQTSFQWQFCEITVAILKKHCTPCWKLAGSNNAINYIEFLSTVAMRHSTLKFLRGSIIYLKNGENIDNLMSWKR